MTTGTGVLFARTFASCGKSLPKLPNRRKWRTALSNALLWSCQGGTLTYQYRDIPMLKQAFEVALYMRLIWETKPGTIIEIGSHSGGAAVWMSDLLKTRFGPSTGRLIAATARCEIVGGLSRVSSTNHVGMSATGPRLSHAYCCASAFTDGGATTMPPSPRTSIPAPSTDADDLILMPVPGCRK